MPSCSNEIVTNDILRLHFSLCVCAASRYDSTINGNMLLWRKLAGLAMGRRTRLGYPFLFWKQLAIRVLNIILKVVSSHFCFLGSRATFFGFTSGPYGLNRADLGCPHEKMLAIDKFFSHDCPECCLLFFSCPCNDMNELLSIFKSEILLN